MTAAYPAPFKTKINRLLGNQAPQFWQALNQRPSRTGLRVNTLKISLQKFVELFPRQMESLPWAEDGFYLPEEINLGKHPYHAAGLFYLQEPSAMAPVNALNPQPGEKVLDLAAAPGGKATQIASRLKQRGLLVANDPHSGRIHALAQNLERWGVRNAVISRERPERLADQWEGFFDRVLVDAPCSGEGMFRSQPSERKRWSEGFVERCTHKQNQILWYAARLVRPGGILVYSTCTFSPEENEGRIEQLLNARDDFTLDPIPALPGYSPGRPDWVGGPEELRGAVRIWPHRAPGEGHFMARLIRRNGDSGAQQTPNVSLPRPSGKERSMYSTFVHRNLSPAHLPDSIAPESSRLVSTGGQLFAAPASAPGVNGLHIHRPGWLLGSFQGERFLPSHALAMGLRPQQVQSMLEFELEDPDLLSFFRGVPLPRPGKPGWVLITTAGYPLGWAYRTEKRLKSHSPRWLRQF